MRKSRSVTLGLLATFAMSACNRQQSNTEMQRCVDDKSFVVDDGYCTHPSSNYPGRYRWYYGGSGSYIPGTLASGGSTSAHAGFTGTRSSSVSRGGFGGYFGHGGGEGGGHGS